MPTKLGNGGTGQENYNPQTGKYVSSSGVTNEALKQWLSEGGDADLSDIYNSLDDQGKEEFLKDLQNHLKTAKTKEKFAARYAQTTDEEYFQWAADCQGGILGEKLDKTLLFSKDPTGDDYRHKIASMKPFSAFYHGYRGAGQDCFNFNKLCRIGKDKFFALEPSLINNPKFSDQAVQERLENLDSLCKFKVPRNCSVYRYVDENWVVAQFGNLLTSRGFQILDNDGYGYRTLDRKQYTVQQIADACKDAIGRRISSDGGITSVSFGSGTHMGKKVTQDTYKRIHIKYDLEQGTEVFVSHYLRESEGLIPTKTSYFLKDVTVEKDQNNLERVVFYMGVDQDGQ